MMFGMSHGCATARMLTLAWGTSYVEGAQKHLERARAPSDAQCQGSMLLCFEIFEDRRWYICFFSTLILYICSQGSVDCKSIPIYTLSESMDIEIPNDYPFCSSHARGSFATRLLRTATPTASTWCVGFWGRSLRSREARMSLDIFSQRTTWDRLWVSHNLTIHRY